MPRNKIFVSTLYSEDWLRRVYVDERRNAAQVAKLIGCTRQAVHGALRRFQIPVKDASAAQRLSEAWPGSSAPRPRALFSATLHDRSWLVEHILGGPSLSAIAELAGCSPSAVLKALERSGLADRWRELRQQALETRREARQPPRQRDFVPRQQRAATTGALHARARRSLPPGPCTLCELPGYDVGHKDGDPSNNQPENLERLCRQHHRQQHALENSIAFEVLAALGVPRIRIYSAARKRLAQERNMAKDQVGASDSVSVGLERSPAKKEDTPRFFCVKCGAIAVKYEEPGKLMCTDPTCGCVFTALN